MLLDTAMLAIVVAVDTLERIIIELYSNYVAFQHSVDSSPTIFFDVETMFIRAKMQSADVVGLSFRISFNIVDAVFAYRRSDLCKLHRLACCRDNFADFTIDHMDEENRVFRAQ